MEDENIETGGSGESTEPSWHIDEATPGVGDRPEWLPEKFKSAQAMAKSYGELEKKLGSSPSAPESYEFGELGEKFDRENKHMVELQEFYKQNKVPQDVFAKTIESIAGYSDSFEVDIAAERAKLGPDADARMTTLDNWAKANFSEKAFNALTSSMGTADAVLAMEEVRNKMLGSVQTPPASEEGAGQDPEHTRAEIEQEMMDNKDKYKTDAKYRAEIRGKLSKVTDGSGFVDKKGG